MPHCHDTGIYMSLPEWEATFLPFPTPTTSLPFSFPSFPQQLSIPFKVPRPSFLLPSSVLRQPSSVRFHTTRLFLLSNLLHLFTSPADSAATSCIILHLSVASNLASRTWAFPHLDGSSIFVCASRPSLCHAPLHNRNYPEP